MLKPASRANLPTANVYNADLYFHSSIGPHRYGVCHVLGIDDSGGFVLVFSHSVNRRNPDLEIRGSRSSTHDERSGHSSPQPRDATAYRYFLSRLPSPNVFCTVGRLVLQPWACLLFAFDLHLVNTQRNLRDPVIAPTCTIE